MRFGRNISRRNLSASFLKVAKKESRFALAEALEGRTLLTTQPITSDLTLAGSVGVGQQNTYTFSAVKGAGIEMVIGVTSGNLRPQVDLYDPNGKDVTYIVTGGTGTGAGGVLQSSAAIAGSYRAVVKDYYGSNTGAYIVTLANVPSAQGSDPQGGVIASSQTGTGTIKGNLHVFTFSAVQARGCNSPSAPPAEIFAPSSTCMVPMENW